MSLYKVLQIPRCFTFAVSQQNNKNVNILLEKKNLDDIVNRMHVVLIISQTEMFLKTRIQPSVINESTTGVIKWQI